VADVLVPARVLPGDRIAFTAYLQSQGLAGQTVRVELSEVAAADAVGADSQATAAAGRVIDTADAILGAGGELVAVRFDVPGLEAPGRRDLAVRVIPPAADRTPADDRQVAEVEVVDRVTQVLLMAGGPSREYQFMRNVLERDKSVAVDVLLGTAGKGGSQDARRILPAFPPTAEELAEYDVVVAFDYDWRRLDAAAQRGIPAVVAPGCLDMVNFGAPETIPAAFAGRRFHRHNAQVTLMRTTPEECRDLGRILAQKVNASVGPATVLLPLGGISMISVPGQPFHDPAADDALFAAIRKWLSPGIPLVELACAINDPPFAEACVERLLAG
jgi:uncharacterized protein (UPF0261 family)